MDKHRVERLLNKIEEETKGRLDDFGASLNVPYLLERIRDELDNGLYGRAYKDILTLNDEVLPYGAKLYLPDLITEVGKSGKHGMLGGRRKRSSRRKRSRRHTRRSRRR